jgi:integrase/recombinase XerD
MTPRAHLTKRIRRADGRWRYCPVVFAANGRIRPPYVLVAGKEEHHPEGDYAIEWYEDGKRRRLNVGTDAADALARMLKKQAQLTAIAEGVEVKIAEPKKPIADAIAVYLYDVRTTRSPMTCAAYRLSLDNFIAALTEYAPQKKFLEQIDRTDLLNLQRYLKRQGLSERTIFNRFVNVTIFLKAQGIDKIVSKRDRPRKLKQEPESYDDDQLKQFFAVCDEEERVFFQFLLMTGLRKKEAAYVYWSDVDLKHGVVRVTAKREHRFKPKDHEERTIPIADALVETLKVWHRKTGDSVLVFPTKNGTPRKHRTQLLEWCKDIAERAGLNPDDFWLHKFRATFATRSLQGGVDLKTVQTWLGHSDIESSMRYLTPAKSSGVKAQVNAVWTKI